MAAADATRELERTALIKAASMNALGDFLPFFQCVFNRRFPEKSHQFGVCDVGRILKRDKTENESMDKK
jgi:hypothetical protein